MKICTVAECENRIYRREWCLAHYKAWRRWGDPKIIKRARNGDLQRWIEHHVDHVGADCLIWPFSRGPKGKACHVMVGNVRIYATRYMCEIVKGPAPSDKHEGAHSCGKGHLGCIHPQHLYWATRQENESDKDRHGTRLRGEQLPQAKLSSEKVTQILSSSMTHGALAKLFGVSPKTIWAVRARKKWKHVPIPNEVTQ